MIEDRYVYSGEDGIWVDLTKPWTDPDVDDEPSEEELFEEVDPGETMNDQDFRITKLETAYKEVTNALGTMTELSEQFKGELDDALEELQQRDADDMAAHKELATTRTMLQFAFDDWMLLAGHNDYSTARKKQVWNAACESWRIRASLRDQVEAKQVGNSDG